MNKILQKLNEITDFKEKQLNEDFRVEVPPTIDIIKELQETNWGNKKKFKRIALKKLSYLAESNDPIALSFFRGLNRASTKIGDIIIKKYQEGYFKCPTE